MRRRSLSWFVAVLVGIGAIAAATSVARASPLFATLDNGGFVGSVPESALVAYTRAGLEPILARFPSYRTPNLADVDFGRYAVVAAFVPVRDTCPSVDIGRLARKANTLVVTAIVDHPAVVACGFALSTTYQVVMVPKTALGRTRPKHVVLKVASWSDKRSPDALMFATIAKGAVSFSPTAPQPFSPRPMLVRNAAEASQLADLLQRPQLATVDFTRYIVLAVFHETGLPCDRVNIAHIGRRGRKLVVSVVVGKGICALPMAVMRYHVVKLRRRSLGRRIPSRIGLQVVSWR